MKNMKYLDVLFQNTQGPKLMILNKVMNFMIPFNLPHKFKFIKINKGEGEIEIPYIKKNLNHLKGIHACSIATGGEYIAGMTLIKCFSPSKYRLIMSNLKVDYFYQGKSSLTGETKLTEEQIDSAFEELEGKGVTSLQLTTKIVDTKENHIADVMTQWQLKRWDLVKTKL